MNFQTQPASQINDRLTSAQKDEWVKSLQAPQSPRIKGYVEKAWNASPFKAAA
jgi:hypothetical protein